MIGNRRIPYRRVADVIEVTMTHDRVPDVAIKLLAATQSVGQPAVIGRRCWADKCAIMMRVADVRETKLVDWIKMLVPVIGDFGFVNPHKRRTSGCGAKNVANDIVVIAKMFSAT